MRTPLKFAVGSVLLLLQTSAVGQPAAAPPSGAKANAVRDPIAELVGRLDLERYKATIKGLTVFGDRRQGTARNRAAIDWIEAQLKSYGCTNTERLTYTFGAEPEHRVAPARAAVPAGSDEPGLSV